MTIREARANDLRIRHARDNDIDPANLLRWPQLQDSEQRQWLRAADAEQHGKSGPRPGFTPASRAQRAAVKDQVSITGERGPVDPAHLTPRSLGGCDDPLCTVPLTRLEHRAFDDGNLDILPYLIAGQRWDEIGHMTTAHGLTPQDVLQRLTGQRWMPTDLGPVRDLTGA